MIYLKRDSDIDIITNNGYITRFWAWMIGNRSASAEAGIAIFLHMENINYPPVDMAWPWNLTFSNKKCILNTSSNGGFSIANLPECNVFVKIVIKRLHFGDVGQARFDYIHRNNLTFGVTFPSPPEKKVKFHHSVNPKMAALEKRLLFFGPLALSVHPTWGIANRSSGNSSENNATENRPKLPQKGRNVSQPPLCSGAMLILGSDVRFSESIFYYKTF